MTAPGVPGSRTDGSQGKDMIKVNVSFLYISNKIIILSRIGLYTRNNWGAIRVPLLIGRKGF